MNKAEHIFCYGSIFGIGVNVAFCSLACSLFGYDSKTIDYHHDSASAKVIVSRLGVEFVLSLGGLGGATEIMLGDAVIAKLQANEFVRPDAIVVSEGCQAFALPIYTRSESSPNSVDLSHIMVIVSVQGRWSPELVLSADTRPKELAMITEVGAVSDDGSRMLLRVLVPQRVASGSVFNAVWQTWDIKRQIQLGEGLRIDNGKTKETK
mgnify:CR=1 FL=1